MMMNYPYTVIIPCFNSGNTLNQALESLCNQTYKNFEVVAINDGSTDNTLAILKSYENQLNITIINQNNLGLGHARNSGINIANGDYLAFLDSDDYWLPNKLEVINGFMHSQHDLFCHNEFILKDKKIIGINKYGPYSTYEDLLFNGNCLSPSAVIIRRKLVLEVGCFMTDHRCHGVEDYDLWLKLAKINISFYYTNLVLGVCRIHSANMSAEDGYRDREDFVLQHHFLHFEKDNDIYLKRIQARKSIQLAARGWDCMRAYKFSYASSYFFKAFKLNPLNKKLYKYLFFGFPKLIKIYFEGNG